MAVDSDIDRSAIWPDRILNPYSRSPSALSVRSTSSTISSDSAFSIDAPSSHSSVSSVSVSWLRPRVNDGAEDPRETLRGYLAQDQRPTLRDVLKENTHPLSQRICSPQPRQCQPNVIPQEARLNPRRTQRLNPAEPQNGKAVSQHPRPPPALVHSSERKVNFVDTLVDTTTQMVETIWPLSAYVQSNHSIMCSRQPSKMDLRYFIQEVLRRSKTSYSTLQVALYYLILIRSCLPTLDFTMEQPEDSPRSFSLQCGRRMFIAALILASKYLQDRNFSANAWSKISGLSTWDLNVNEMAFLSTISWKLHIPGHVFDRWVDIVLKYSPSSPPRSSPKPTISWKDVVLRLTPDLDTIDFGGAELSDDSGYDSPGSDMSPPPIPIRDDIVSRSNEPTPTPSCSIPQWLEQTPSETREQKATLPPLQPHLAPLPTPDLTPQIGPFCTPAVSAQGTTRRLSMSQTMCQIQEASLARSTLDHTSEWKPRVSESFPTLGRRTSLTTSSSSMSSPDLMSDVSTQYSDASSRPSRSSSISSVASSNCAPPQPTRLAVQATRRCANMQLNGLKDEGHQSGLHGTFKQLSWLEFVGKTEANPPRLTSSHMKEASRIFKEERQAASLMDGTRETSHINAENSVNLHAIATCVSGPPKSFDNYCLTQPLQRQKESRKLPHSFAAHASADSAAAAALQELALDYQQRSTTRPRSTDSRKRARPNSMDLSIEDAVRNIIAPRCLGDITNMQNQRNEEDSTVIPDDHCADSFVLRKENKHAIKKGANKRPTKSAAAPTTSSRDTQPRKKTCAGSDRGGREEARMLERMVQQAQPGIWEAVSRS